jgi:hypothetical protein
MMCLNSGLINNDYAAPALLDFQVEGSGEAAIVKKNENEAALLSPDEDTVDNDIYEEEAVSSLYIKNYFGSNVENEEWTIFFNARALLQHLRVINFELLAPESLKSYYYAIIKKMFFLVMKNLDISEQRGQKKGGLLSVFNIFKKVYYKFYVLLTYLIKKKINRSDSLKEFMSASRLNVSSTFKNIIKSSKCLSARFSFKKALKKKKFLSVEERWELGASVIPREGKS